MKIGWLKGKTCSSIPESILLKLSMFESNLFFNGPSSSISNKNLCNSLHLPYRIVIVVINKETCGLDFVTKLCFRY